MKSAFEDDEEDEIILKPVEKKPLGIFGKELVVPPAVTKKKEVDNGLFVDNDFGDDFDDEEDEDEETPKNNAQ